MAQHFHEMGISTIGGLAHFPVEKLRREWGINGELLWQTANGIDPSPVTSNTHQARKNIGHGMTLPHDYERRADILVLLRELAEEVARRAREEHVLGRQVALSVGGPRDSRRGFHRQAALQTTTNDGKVIFQACKRLFDHYWLQHPIRKLSVALEKVVSDDFRQMSLFEEMRDREGLNKAMDNIKDKYGTDSLMYASSLTSGQALERAKKIGGHYK